jgi:hypothetical protein
MQMKLATANTAVKRRRRVTADAKVRSSKKKMDAATMGAAYRISGWSNGRPSGTLTA